MFSAMAKIANLMMPRSSQSESPNSNNGMFEGIRLNRPSPQNRNETPPPPPPPPPEHDPRINVQISEIQYNVCKLMVELYPRKYSNFCTGYLGVDYQLRNLKQL